MECVAGLIVGSLFIGAVCSKKSVSTNTVNKICKLAEGNKNISAIVIADSISQDGHRITTYELEYPRFIHAEFMTHRLFSRNAASSRAIPVRTQLQNIREHTAHPIHWGANRSGMQAFTECEARVRRPNSNEDLTREDAWREAAASAAEWAEKFDEAGYHKQVANRPTEPFSHIKVVCTATEYENFFHLRRHPAAQPEIQELANQMFLAREESSPRLLEEDDWHLPYIDDTIREEVNRIVKDEEPNQLLRQISASCCAQVSYRKNDTSIEKALKICNQLAPSMISASPVHASPFEHQATPILPTHNYKYPGITHTCHRDGSRWSGNFRYWIQYRQLLPNHTKW